MSFNESKAWRCGDERRRASQNDDRDSTNRDDEDCETFMTPGYLERVYAEVHTRYWS